MMPVTIGARQADFDHPIELLGDCHRRIERFLAVLQSVAGEGGSLNGTRRESFERALVYFRNSAPKHTADEEESVFPRMRSHGSEIAAALERIAALEADHQRSAAAHADVDRLGSLWLSEGQLSKPDLEHLRELLADLSRLYSAHIAVEEREVFPLAERVLDKDDRRQIGVEMRHRRGHK